MNLVDTASWWVALAAIVVGIAALAVFRQPLPAMRVTLDLLVAAGLLRLSLDVSWTAIAGTALLIAVRRLLTRSLASDFTATQHRAHA